MIHKTLRQLYLATVGVPTSVAGKRVPMLYAKAWASGALKDLPDASFEVSIPWLQGPLELIRDAAWLKLENAPCLPTPDPLSREYRSSTGSEDRPLPWLDRDKAIIIAVNKRHGDDLALAMDLRTSTADPALVATYWIDGSVEWRLVTSKLSDFLTHESQRVAAN